MGNWTIWDCLSEKVRRELVIYQRKYHDPKWENPTKPELKGIVIDVILETTEEIGKLMAQAPSRSRE